MSSLPSSTALTPADVRAEIRRRILAAAGDRVLAIVLHGSRVRGTARKRSDWDVAVVLREPVDDWIAESLRLSAPFYDCPFAVDLQAFGEAEFRADSTVPGTLAFTVARRGEWLHDATLDPPRRGRPGVGRLRAG